MKNDIMFLCTHANVFEFYVRMKMVLQFNSVEGPILNSENYMTTYGHTLWTRHLHDN